MRLAEQSVIISGHGHGLFEPKLTNDATCNAMRPRYLIWAFYRHLDVKKLSEGTNGIHVNPRRLNLESEPSFSYSLPNPKSLLEPVLDLLCVFDRMPEVRRRMWPRIASTAVEDEFRSAVLATKHQSPLVNPKEGVLLLEPNRLSL